MDWQTAAVILTVLLALPAIAIIVFAVHQAWTGGPDEDTQAEYREQRRRDKLAMLEALHEVVPTATLPGQPIYGPSVPEALGRVPGSGGKARALLAELHESEFELPITRGFVDPERYPLALAHLMRYMNEHPPVGEAIDFYPLMRDEIAAAISKVANSA